MKMPTHGGLLAAVFGLSLIVCAGADCGATSADNCLEMAHADKLPSTDDLGTYCPIAVEKLNKINVCIDNCNFPASSAIQNLTLRIQNSCEATSDCSNVISQYSDYAGCFDKSGGLQAIIDGITSAFNAKQSTDALCRALASGRYCQKSAFGKCRLFTGLDGTLYSDYPMLASVQHICGSENVPDLHDNSTCNSSDEMVSEIEKNCNVACSIAATSDPATICAFFQDQVNCMLEQSEGCTEVERRFLLPRLNTYAIINLLLPCPTAIQIRGLTVQPAGLSPDYPESFRCSYIAQINQCFQMDVSEPARADTLEKLFGGNFLLDQFCQLQSDGKFDRQSLLKSCTDSYLRCRLPLAEVYSTPPAYDDSYGTSLGPFPLDMWGLNTVLTSLSCPSPSTPTVCPAVRPTVRETNPTMRPTPEATKRTTPAPPKKSTAKTTKRATPRPMTPSAGTTKPQ